MTSMVECWASVLGSCAEKMSREHIVSQGLFIGDVVRVEGFSWCKGEPKEIGLSSLTSRILCKKHNEELSTIDEGGASAFKAFREMRRVANVREKLKPQVWNVVRYTIDGQTLERWFLKTLINISYDGEYPIGGECTRGKPTEELVRIAYGLSAFSGIAGLYSVVRVGQNINSTDRIGFSPLIKDKRFVAGGFFSFRGFTFLLFLLPEGPPTPLTGVQFEGEDVGKCQLNHHNHRRIRDIQGRHVSQILEFKW